MKIKSWIWHNSCSSHEYDSTRKM